MDERPIELPGVRITVMRSRPARGPRLYWRARRSGTRETVWTGWATREEAMLAVVAKIKGGALQSGRADRRAARTVGELLDRWVEVQRERRDGGQIAERSLVAYEGAVAYWTAAIRDVSLRRLSRADVEDVVRGWRADKVSARTCRHAVTVLGTALRWGERRDWCEVPDLRRLEGTAVRDDERVYDHHTPIRADVDAVLDRMPLGRDRTIVRLLALTGARIGEVLALTVGDYDPIGRTLRLYGRRPGRRGKVPPRLWPVTGELGELLEDLVADRAPDQPLVEGLATGMASQVRRSIHRAAGLAKVTAFSPHGLRRMVATELVQVADPASVSLLTGHSVRVLLETYVRPRKDALRDVVTRARLGRLNGRGQVVSFRREEG